jgi:hypothetical protein
VRRRGIIVIKLQLVNAVAVVNEGPYNSTLRPDSTELPEE